MNIKDDDLAVIGMSGKFPGANSVAEFWDNICAKKESIRTLSDDELRSAGVPEADLADSAYVKSSALLDDVDMFDPGFFKISPLEAELMDPQIRLLLQCAWETLEDAGYARTQAQNIGVFAGAGGVTTSYFANFVNVHERFQKITAGATHLGNDKDFLATYISYKLNLTGPSMTVQTACSTSLVALHQARQSLLSGECDMALAGGVTVRVPHVRGYHYKEGYIFSRSGRIMSFDQDADGVVFGSGLGLVLIKRLADAIADGDNIHAVIKGSAIMNDGKGKMSYAASSAKGQIACVRAALAKAGVDAESIGFIESHGTGTAMGDPEEVKALSAAFREETDKKAFCALGAVKANVGHLEAAAGIAGFIKAVMAVKHGFIPPVALYASPNPRIKFENSPFYVNTELQTWSGDGKPRRAAVNSLGVGGTNAFVILEQHVAPPRMHKTAGAPVVVPLSARTETSLRAQVRKLAGFLAADAGQVDLADLAYTLQSGRDAMQARVAFVVATVPELERALAGYLETKAAPLPAGDAADWVGGADIDWSVQVDGAKPRRISLPTYAFAKERCWIDSAPATPSGAMLHPLVHLNSSDLNEQKYSATFSGDEFFLRDHLVRTKARSAGAGSLQKVLPAVAYLEMARAAVELASPIHRDTSVVELRDVVWLRPISVAADTQVNIALASKPSGRVDFEVYTADDQIHCQGNCTFSAMAAPEHVDPVQLKQSMAQGAWPGATIYAAFARMGLDYGSAYRSITGIERGERELLAHLALPASVAAGASDYLLHPSLLDGALQAATTLLFDPENPPAHPIVPFSIDSVRIVAPCTANMLAWVRHARHSRPGDKSASFDIDLLDADGTLRVRIAGFAPRSLGRETIGVLLATQVWEQGDAAAGPAALAEQHVLLCGLPRVEPDRIARDCAVVTQGTGSNIAQRYSDLAVACFDKVKTLLLAKPQGKTLVQIVLPNTGDNDIHTGLAGMLKTARLENPLVGGQIVLVDAAIGTEQLGALLQADRGRPHDTLIKYENGVRHTANWRFLSQEEPGVFDAHSPFKDHGVYLITGGLGGLGVLFAREILARSTNPTIILTGRAPEAEVGKLAGKQALLASLQAAGAVVEYRQLDLEDMDQVGQLVASIRAKYRQLNGILHSAGMNADAFILKKDADQFGQVLAPKVTGAFNLDMCTRDVDLDFMVLFSSLSSAVGNIGQADYAAANGFLDQFAAVRNRLVKTGERRGATLSIAWPLWQYGGMQTDAAGRDMLYETTGIYPMRTSTGMQMFYRSLALGHDQTLVMEGDLPSMQRSLGVGAALHDAASTETPEIVIAGPAAAGLAQQCEAFLGQQMAALLKLPAHKIDARAQLGDYGIDSILALDLTRVLERTFGALPKTLFFEYLTIRELAAYFINAHGAAVAALFAEGGSAQAPAIADVTASIRCRARASGAPAAAAKSDAIAIVGLSGRYPQAPGLQAFWNNLRDGKDCIVEVPKDRWDWRDYYSEDRSQPGRHYSKWGGFIEGVDEFDARFFNISPLEAEKIDPQERLFLQHAWMAIEDAGFSRGALQVPNGNELPGQVGVYAGVMYGEYQLFGAEASLQGQRMGFSSNLSSIANRVSYVLNLHGPSMAVDTMCSSSLTAIHLACQDLKLGRTSLAIAGGVSITIHPNKYLMLSAGQFISGDGHCQSFGEGGDGYIPGEGVGVVVLKRLSEAERDGNHIYGVIRGSALSHGGRTNGYTVPNPQAQASAIRQSLAEAGVEARHVSYIEAHGTGTKLGDPIEIAALSRVFQEGTQDTGFCLIGSAKSNIGHCEAAAGIAGLTKVLLQMKHKHIVPSLHSARLNPHIDFGATPFVVNQTLTPWVQPVVNGKSVPRIAGISSFGAGGANAHLIVEEYQAAVPARADGACIVPLSARTAGQLVEKVRDLIDFIGAQELPLSLASLSWTLQVGREAMDERLAVVAASATELAARLQDWLDAKLADGVYQGQASAGQATDAGAAPGDRNLPHLAALWTGGLELDWGSLHDIAPALISLPTYPFAKQRFWIDPARAARSADHALAASRLHPLLHANTSDFDQQSYTSTFSGDRLTSAACLEMARAAIDAAMPASKESGMLELRDVAWAHPAIAADGPVTIALFDKRGDQMAFEIYSGADVVHCQGRAARIDQPAPARLDLALIGAELVALRQPAASEQYVLHPSMIDSILTAAPNAMASLRIIFPSSVATMAWVRRSVTALHASDVDLCDAQGNVCVQMRGLTVGAVAEAPTRIAAIDVAPLRPIRIDFDVNLPQAAMQPAAHATMVRLGGSTPVPANGPVLDKPNRSIVLSTPQAPHAPSAVSLLDHGNGVFGIQVDAAASANLLSAALIADLQSAMRTVALAPSAKVLTIEGTDAHFLNGSLEQHRAASAAGLYRTIVQFPYPVIAVVGGEASGSGFLLAALCDFMVCSDGARLAFAQPEQGLYPSAAEAVLVERFGRVHATDFLYFNDGATGASLKMQGWTCPVLPAEEVAAHARQLAVNLAQKSQASLRLLKQHMARRIDAVVQAMPPADAAPVVTAAGAVRSIASPSARLQVAAHGDAVLVVTIRAQAAQASAQELLSDLETVFARIEDGTSYRCVVLASELAQFLPQAPDAAQGLRNALLAFTRPVIAALDGDANGHAWYVAQFCDACVHSEQGRYSALGVVADDVAAVFTMRFGAEHARRLLMSGAKIDGALHVVAAAQVRAHALALADTLTALPAPVLSAWKLRTVAALAANAACVALEGVDAFAGEALALESTVISAIAHPEGILEVRMADRDAKNMFSDAFSRGMREVFAHVAKNCAYKVVLLTGYDSYFSAGGTPDTLLAIHEGRARFTDNNVFQLPLDCPIPVIAAMQGHGIGAGWAMGMYADFALFSDESRYFSPYMGYGFTPGAGSTLVFPEKIGHDLARETLLTAQEYSGGALKERGLRQPVMARDQVLPAAMALARQVAQLSRGRLVALKKHFSEPVKASLQDTFERELAMHELTFVGQADTLARIEGRFGADSQAVAPVYAAALPATEADLGAMTTSLRQMLANELRMPEQDIGDDEQFVDLGLDSITGVTWIRRINETYATTIEAIKVYSYPTLAKLARFVLSEMPTKAATPIVAASDASSVTAILRAMLAHELRMQESDIDDDEQFVDLGLDSITGVTWIRGINSKYGTAIEAIKIYSYPTLRQLSAFVRAEAEKAGTLVEAPAVPVAVAAALASWRKRGAAKSEPASVDRRVAIVGMAGQFAKAGNLDQFWTNIAQGRDCIGEISKDRWDTDQYFQEGDAAPGKTYSRWMGALDDHDRFDAAFFNISPREAKSMDPQQRLFLQSCWHSIEHAGYQPKALGGSKCGVFVGCSAGDYHQLSKREQLSGQGFIGAAPSILAARISYFLDLHGPSMSIDTACSSSLVAIATACDSLGSGASDIALAGGVNVMAGPAMQIMTAQVGMLSPQGRCFTFDARADGIVNGEGVGVVMLKRLADAERDGDCIYGVIEGWGVNQDGKTNGITAPNPDSQTRLQQDVYERFAIDPAAIGLIEAHGTGTPLGDPIEVAGLKASFAKFTQDRDYCALGSVKSNIGHCLTAAGISGVLKAVLALKHGQLPPTIHFKELNKHIALKDTPFYVNDRLREWKPKGDAARRAAINSFGFGGTNAHVVIAEYRDRQDAAGRGEQIIVPLSARTVPQLQEQARDLLAFIRAHGAAALNLDRISYTLQTGREPMDERAAFIAGTVAELETRLQAFIDGANAPQTWRGTASANEDSLLALGADADFQTMIGKWIMRSELARLADLWVKGLDLDWTVFQAGRQPPRRVGLPGYRFAKERFWIDPEAEPPIIAVAPAAAAPIVVQPQADVRPSVSRELVQQQLKASLAEALFMQSADIDVNKSFTELGLDSIIGVEWVKAINKQHGSTLSATRVYDYPCVKDLAAFLMAETAVPAITAPPVVLSQPVPSENLQQQLKASLAEALFMQPHDIGMDKSFTELGLDSIIGVEWVKAINKQYGSTLSATRIYDYPTVRELATFLGGQMPAAARTKFERKDGAQSASLYFGTAGIEGDFERDGEFSVRCTISPDTNVSMKEHVVFGAHLLPTDAYIELVYAACKTYFSAPDIALKNIVIVNPMIGVKGRDTHVKLVFRRAGDELQFFVKSSVASDFRNDMLHMQGFLAIGDTEPVSRFDDRFTVEKSLGNGQIPTNAGSYYAPLQALHFGHCAALGLIHVASHDFEFLANPLALYGGLCTAINYAAFLAARDFGPSDDQFLPYRIGRIAVLDALRGSDYRCYAQVRRIEHDAVDIYVEMVDPAGKTVVVIDEISLRRVARQVSDDSPLPARVEVPAPATMDQVAIIGMSARLPMSENVDVFWDNLKAGRDCVVEVPEQRWAGWDNWYNADPRNPHTAYSKWAGLLDNFDSFDSLFFGISPAEAELIDPQQRVFLEECWNAIENAGYAPSTLSNRACAVYVGCTNTDYARVLAREGQDSVGAAFMGTSNAILAARISYHLNLKGPAVALDTACSSSLVAVHLACAGIRSGETEMALAGGVNLLSTPIGHVLTSQVGMPSRDGRCASFDASANGIVFSEGCGVLLLKSLAAAQRDGDNILGVIAASGINQDGKTNGITAPSSRAQEQLLRQVYKGFGIDPKRISYVEAHGTATPLGDPIEVNALSAVFGAASSQKNYCALGSVKSNMGHAGVAAGVAGIVKVLLCLKHQKLVPSIHYSQPNPHLELDQSPFYVNTQYRDWVSDQPRMATVSSFGFSGTNAHVVIGEHVPGSRAPQAASGANMLLPLSAKAPEQLRQKVRDLLDFIGRQERAVDMASLAYTLQLGRDAMDHRLAFIAATGEELAAKLSAWLDGKAGNAQAYLGQGPARDDTFAAFTSDPEMRKVIDGWIARKELPKVADLWVKGLELDWNSLHDGARPARMVLPGYPFARQRCWVEATAPRRAASAGTAATLLHPLLHRNTSNLGQQNYSSTFSGNEFFLADHQVNGQPVLPAVAYLEMARAALADALPSQAASQLELRHVAWSQPIVVTEPRNVTIDVFSEEGGQLGFEVYSHDGGAEVLHCQGSCVVSERGVPATLDLSRLRAQMTRGSRAGSALYPVFAGKGLNYGPSFQAIEAIHLGHDQLLVDLSLRRGDAAFILQPGMMDSALQGSIALIDDLLRGSGKSSLPFALEALNIVAPCTDAMVAWVRFSGATPSPSASLVKVDIDLCDTDGKVCVQMRGFSSRPMESLGSFDEAHYHSIIAGIASNEISIDEAVQLGDL